MAAIITPRFRKNNAAAFKADLTASDYYIGLGRAESWPTETAPPTPTGSPLELIQTKTGLIQMKEIRSTIDGGAGLNSLSRMVPRVDWVAGRTFKAYSISDITTLYSSTSGSTTTYPAYCINNLRLYLCTTKGSTVVANAPVHTGSSVTGADGYTWQYLMDLVTSTTLNLQNFIAIPDSDSQTLETLPSWYVGIGVDVYSADLFIDTKYRQVSVVKFPNALSPKVNIISAKHFVMNPAITPTVGSIITQSGNANARGVVVRVDSTKVYFTQTPNADGTVTAFNSSGNLIINGAGSAPYTSIAETLTDFGVHTKTSLIPQGEVVFLENRQSITHASGQVEEIRVVIQF